MAETLAIEVQYIRNDIEKMNVKLDQVMSFMALMQGADIQKRVDKLIDHDVIPIRNRVDSLEKLASKLIGIYLTLGGVLLLINLAISLIALFKK